MRASRGFVLIAAVTVLSVTIVCAQTWTPITNTPPFNPGAMLLLTDGRVLVHSEPNCASCTSTDYNSWYTLTPDETGSYVNGSWTKVAAPAGYAPLYFGSAVLPDGKVIVEGGEYDCSSGSCNSAWQNHGALYDPATNSWTAVAPSAGWTSIGDAQSTVLPNGTYMQANCCTLAFHEGTVPQAALFDESTLTWTAVADTGKHDEFDEEGWTLLPNGKILTVDAYVGSYSATGTNSELYTAGKTQTWKSAGSTIQQLWDSASSCGGTAVATYELGPAVLRPDGTVFYTGANFCGAGHTAIYDSITGKWTAGPDFTGIFAANDAPAALEPNGNVIVFTGSGPEFSPPGQFFEWNGSTLSLFTTPTSAEADGSYVGHLLILPTGQIMFTDFTTSVQILTPSGSAEAGWAPTIKRFPPQVAPGKSYSLAGTQFNGLSQGSAYGDDFQNATNYPLVRIVNNQSGHVFYCKTHGHSTMAVATGTLKVSTTFDVPKNIEAGESQLFVVANGIASAGVGINVK